MTDGLPPPSTPARPPVPAQPTEGATKEWYNERIILLVCAGAMLAGSFGPWLVVQSGFGSIAVNGMDGDGKFTAAGAAAVGLCVFVSKYIGVFIAAGLSAAGSGYDYWDAQRKLEELDSDMMTTSIGWGLYAVVGASILAFILGIVCYQRERRPVTHVEFTAPHAM